MRFQAQRAPPLSRCLGRLATALFSRLSALWVPLSLSLLPSPLGPLEEILLENFQVVLI